MKNTFAAGISYLPGKWENLEYKIISYLKNAVSPSFTVKPTLFKQQQLFLERRIHAQAQQISQLQAELQQKDEQLKTISYHQSHTVRRPLANMLGIVELMKFYQENPPDDDFFKMLALLQTSSAELDEVISSK